MLKPSSLDAYLKQYPVKWKLPMPPGCPPDDIEIPYDHPLYRLTHAADGTMSEQDLLTYSEIDPKKDWGDLLPMSLSLSLFESIVKAKDLFRLPGPRKQGLKGVAEICLNPTDGVVKQTGRKGHYSWWQTVAYDLSNHKPVKI